MRYRIKVTTYQNGNVEYTSEVSDWWRRWDYLNRYGHTTSCRESSILVSREEALSAIDKHYGDTVKSLEIDYIIK